MDSNSSSRTSTFNNSLSSQIIMFIFNIIIKIIFNKTRPCNYNILNIIEFVN